jgi:hypothetical protein
MMEKKNRKGIHWMLAVVVCIVPAACDRLGGGLEHREKVAVGLSFGGLEPWGAETVVRGASEVPVERASVALEGNWVLEVAWTEEPAVPTRANLSDGAVLRVVAANGSGVVDEKDYVCQSDGSLEPGTGGPVLVEPGSYGLMAYSYHTTAPGTPTPTSSGTTVGVSPYVDGTANNDLIATVVPVVITVGSGGGGPSLSLIHRFSRVKYSKNIPQGAPVTISSVSLTNNYTAALNKATGALPKVTAVVQSLNQTTPRMVYTQEEAPKLSVSGLVNNVFFTRLVSYGTRLEGGKSYTLHINVKQGRAWAGSNVYWDDDSKCLTFKEAGHVGEENYYQGVYFRWGSLVGISPVGAFDTGENDPDAGTILYVYHNGQWEKTTVAEACDNGYSGFLSTNVSWTGIPYVSTGMGSYTANNLGGSFVDNTGDICRFLDPGYRLPVASEFAATAGAYTWGTDTDALLWYKGGSFSSVVSGNEFGQHLFDPGSGAGCATNYGSAFPAAGCRKSGDGELENVGTHGYYRSSSANYNTTNGAYSFYYRTADLTVDNSARQYGFTVRCLTDE